jgi:hypothetical protein
LQVPQGLDIQLDFCALTCAVDGAETDAGRYAVDNCLSDVNASFAVVGSDSEPKIYDVGLVSTECHVKGLSFSRCNAGLFVSSLGDSLTFYIYYTTKKRHLSTLFSILNDFKHLEHFPLMLDFAYRAREMTAKRKKAILKRSMISST